MTEDHQVGLSDRILEEVGVEEGQSFVVRVRGHTIELIPAEVADQVLDEGLDDLQRASLAKLSKAWDNPEGEVWDEVHDEGFG